MHSTTTLEIDMIRKLICRLGMHSWFRQWDKWGTAKVCRYCSAVRAAGGAR